MNEKEEWRDGIGYEGYYQVSNHGRVKSLDKYVSNGKGIRLRKGRILKLRKDTAGYPTINMSKNNKVETKAVHIIVLTAFDRPPEEGEECNHKDGIKCNGFINNLEWCTPKENIRHKVEVLGKTQACNIKLTEQKVREIRGLLKQGKLTQKQIADKYNVCTETIHRIKIGKIWKN